MTCRFFDRRDLAFQLYQLHDLQSLCRWPRFAEHNRETFDATLDLATEIAVAHFEPHAAKQDEQEPTFDGERVTMIEEVAEALCHYYEAGFGAATQDYEIGGMQLPLVVSVAAKAIFSAANVSTGAYAMLSTGNANVIRNFGSDDQRRRFMAPLFEGRFSGTMALTEPQAGSSLSDIRTTATRGEDGVWRLKGQKIFISGGDHELAENIIHLVLCRTAGAPAGVRGLSLFIVPKYLVNADGEVGERNDVALAGLIHKMCYRGTTSTMLSFGEQQGAIGELVGEEGKGLLYMFQMMNEARIGVGVGAVALGYAGYRYALEYARERPQGRHAQDKDPTTPQLPIIEHTDVRRMLLAAKCFAEGGLSLSLYGAKLADTANYADNEAERTRAALLLDILTPVLKSWPSKYCLEANSLAIQVHGGYGYTREYPVERLYRDNRLNPIHEGTEGIQSLDLLGRKVRMHHGEAYRLVGEEMRRTLDDAAPVAALAPEADALTTALADLDHTTAELTSLTDMDALLQNASLYLDAFGHCVVGWLWLRQGLVAHAALSEASGDEAAFYQGKIAACRFFMRWELPKMHAQCALLRSHDSTCREMQADWF